jgi:membrane-associated phospholipid phosphatase
MIIRFKKREILLEHSPLIIFPALAVLVFCYGFVDIPLALYLHKAAAPFQGAATLISSLFRPSLHHVLWPLLFFVTALFKKSRALTHACLLLVISIPLANLGAAFLKPLVGRPRPELLFSKGVFGFTGFHLNNSYLSFPSSHACTIGACVGFLACLYPRYTFAWMGLGCALAFSRVVLEDHYLSDVLAGVLIGMFATATVHRLQKKWGRYTALRQAL